MVDLLVDRAILDRDQPPLGVEGIDAAQVFGVVDHDSEIYRFAREAEGAGTTQRVAAPAPTAAAKKMPPRWRSRAALR